MRYRLYGSKIKTIKKRVSSFTAALVLAVTSISGAAPLFFSQTATAAPNTTYSSVPFTSLGLSTDRSAPSGGPAIISSNSLQLNVDNNNANTSSHSTQTEGLGSSHFAQVNSVQATLSVPSDWQGKPIDAGLWGVSSLRSDSSAMGWPIIAFISEATDTYLPHGATGFAVYNTFTGAWTTPSGFNTSTGWDKTYDLEINYNPATNNFEFYVDGAPLTSYSATDGADSYDGLDAVIFNNFNTSTGDSADDYSVNWTNFKTGLKNPDAPTGLHFTRGANPVADASIVNYADISLKWNAVPNAERYQIRVTDPSGAQQQGRYTGTPRFDLDDHARYGYFSDQQGEWKYEVRVKDNTTKLWSAWSTPVMALTYDTSAPVIDPITANGRNFNKDGSAIVSGKNGITFQFTITDGYAGHDYTYAEVKKANGSWVAGTSGLHLRGSTPTWTIPANKVTAEGIYKLKLCPRDNIGNSTCDTYQFRVDNTSPTMLLREGESGPIVNDGSVIDNTGKNIRIEKENTATIHVTKPDGSTWTGGKKDASYAGGKLSMDWLFTINGPYTFNVEDEAGNVSPDYTITIDNVGPIIENISVAKRYTNESTVKVSGTVSDTNLDYYRCNIYDATNHNGLNGLIGYYTRNYSSVTDGELCNIPVNNLPEGNYNVRVVAYDQAGHVNTNGYAGYLFTIDRTAPTATLVFSAPGPSATSFGVQFNEAVSTTDAENPANYFLNNWPGAGGSGDLSGDATVIYNESTHLATVTFTNSGWYVSPEQQWGVENIHDLAGNLLNPSPTTAYSTPLVDPTVPGNPTATSPTNNSSIAWAWQAATDPGGVNASGVKGYYYTLTQGSTVVVPTTFTSNTFVTTPVPGEGTYTLTVYAIDDAGNTGGTATGIVVVDMTAPDITVTGGNQIVEAGDAYIEQGATWTDSVDGNNGIITAADITSDTVKTLVPGVYTLTYTHTDDAGNPGIGTRTVTVVDTTAPVVTLTGSNQTLTVGDTYTEQGATWTDIVDGSGTVTAITGTVDTSTPGVYTVTYTYTDAAGNTGTATRTVTINAPRVLGDNTNKPNTLAPTTTTTGGGSTGDSSGSGQTGANEQGDGNVKAAETTTKVLANDTSSTKDTTSNSNFLGLGWWWLAVLAALLGFFWFLLGKRDEHSEK